MKKILLIITSHLLLCFCLSAQTEPEAGKWKTWFISSGKDHRLSQPPSKNEIEEVISVQKNIDAPALQNIRFWNAGSPGYRWQEMMSKIWVVDTGRYGVLASMLLSTSIYDATIAAWDTKYAWKRLRPYEADKKIKVLAIKPESPSYPCEYSVAAGVAVTVFAKFYPHLADSVNKMAQAAMTSRVAAGMAFPTDTKAGFELGKKIALMAIEKTKDNITTAVWDGKTPTGPQYWYGKFALHPVAGKNKTMVLDSASQFRPLPPPDFAKDMAELKNFKQTFRSRANAFFYASQNPGDDILQKKIFEYNLHTNAPRAARIYAATAVAMHDGFIACWDAKYAYWGIRPDQYDTTYKPIVPTPPFPGYPSGHAMAGGVTGELYTYFFPADEKLFRKNTKDGAESRFQAGIHFRTDNEAGTELGKRIALAVIEKLKHDGADQ